MKNLLFLAILVVYIFCPFCKTYAEEIKSSDSRATVIPAKFELWGIPGESLTQSLKITNEDSEDAILAITMESFGIADDQGGVTLGYTETPYLNELRRWVIFDQRGAQFAAKETKFINYKIDIPKDAMPGGRYAAIVLSMDRVHRQPGDSQASTRVVSLLMLSVAGNIYDNAAITDFTIQKNQDKGEYAFQLDVKNEGNNHIKPKGMIVITNFLGKHIDEIPFTGENVLPGTNRVMTANWKPKHPLFGRYTATVVTNYGAKNQPLTGASTFSNYPPIYFIILFGVIMGFFWNKKRKR